jgi:HlyD family secretion protein
MTDDVETRATQNTPTRDAQKPSLRSAVPAALIVAVMILGVVGLSIWYLLQPQPLLVQGEADARRFDIAARIDGRVWARPVDRGQNVAAAQLLVVIDNPELLTKLKQAEAARAVAEADLQRILVGTRQEVITSRRASLAAAEADLTFQQQSYQRTHELAERDFASMEKLDEATNTLDVARRSVEQAKAALDEAVAGYTPEERKVAEASVGKADADIATIQAQVDELKVVAPTAGQVYQVGVEVGEYVSPGVPLLSVVDLGDVWLRFDLREDLVKRLKVGDKVSVTIPALNRNVQVEVRTIATRGEYSGWRATRATGDFDLRTFEVRAYPVEPVPELRPGMSAYVDVGGRS